jgi:hypothetical protein
MLDLPCENCICLPVCIGKLNDLFRVICHCNDCDNLHVYVYQHGSAYEVYFAQNVIDYVYFRG